MAWTERRWELLDKHRPRGGHKSWAAAVRETNIGRRWARYKNGLSPDEIEALDVAAFGADGRVIKAKANERNFYVVSEGVIGASLGEETNIVKVKWTSDGTFHGHPITERELKDLLRKHNPMELAWYEARGA